MHELEGQKNNFRRTEGEDDSDDTQTQRGWQEQGKHERMEEEAQREHDEREHDEREHDEPPQHRDVSYHNHPRRVFMNRSPSGCPVLLTGPETWGFLFLFRFPFSLFPGGGRGVGRACG